MQAQNAKNLAKVLKLKNTKPVDKLAKLRGGATVVDKGGSLKGLKEALESEVKAKKLGKAYELFNAGDWKQIKPDTMKILFKENPLFTRHANTILKTMDQAKEMGMEAKFDFDNFQFLLDGKRVEVDEIQKIIHAEKAAGRGRKLPPPAEVESIKDIADKTLEKYDTVKKATSIVGPEREKYLKALEISQGPKLQRAQDMGFDTSEKLYHGTPHDFENFKQGSDGMIHAGTKEQANARIRDLADRYSSNSRNFPVYLKGKNFLRTKDHGSFSGNEIIKDAERAGHEFDESAIRHYNYLENSQDWDSPTAREWKDDALKLRNKLLKEKGYDGIVYKNTGEIPDFIKENIDKLEHELAAKRYQLKDELGVNPKNRALYDDQTRMIWDALGDVTKLKEMTVDDSKAVFDPNQVRSIFAAFDKRFKDSDNIMAGIAGGGVTLPLLLQLKEQREKK